MRGAWDRLENLPSKTAVREAAGKHTREYLISMLAWNDRNGVFTDKDCELEGMKPMTKADAINLIVQIIDDSVWRYDDPRRKMNPGRKVRGRR
jgi:hypothetical protein